MEVGRLFGNHHNCKVGIGVNHFGHDGSVPDPEILRSIQTLGGETIDITAVAGGSFDGALGNGT